MRLGTSRINRIVSIRTTYGLFGGICTFMIGLAAALWFVDHHPRLNESSGFRRPLCETFTVPCSGVDVTVLSNVRTVGFCELVRNMEFYNGKVIRMRARYQVGKHAEVLNDKKCPGNIVVRSERSGRDEIEDALLHAQESDPYKPLTVTVVGKVKVGRPSYGHDDIWGADAPLQFEVMRLEGASKALE